MFSIPTIMCHVYILNMLNLISLKTKQSCISIIIHKAKKVLMVEVELIFLKTSFKISNIKVFFFFYIFIPYVSNKYFEKYVYNIVVSVFEPT